MPDMIETLATQDAGLPDTVGFKIPFGVDRLCLAFGENLGGNRPEPSWFEGCDILVAMRRTDAPPTSPSVAALMRRRSDGALRLIASDQIQVRDGYGADYMLARRHEAIAIEALASASDDGPVSRAMRRAMAIIHGATASTGEGPVDILAERRVREDLADVRAARAIRPVVLELRRLVSTLSSPDRRALSQRQLESLAAEIGVEMGD